MYDQFVADLVPYNAEVVAYDNAVAARKAHSISWTDVLFETVVNVAIPNKPCPPDRPPVYTGLKF